MSRHVAGRRETVKLEGVIDTYDRKRTMVKWQAEVELVPVEHYAVSRYVGNRRREKERLLPRYDVLMDGKRVGFVQAHESQNDRHYNRIRVPGGYSIKWTVDEAFKVSYQRWGSYQHATRGSALASLLADFVRETARGRKLIVDRWTR